MAKLSDDIAFAELANSYRKGDALSAPTNMPDITHMAGASVGAGALLLALMSTDQPENLKTIALIGAIVLFALANVCDTFLRGSRNVTERHRIQAASEPSVVIAHTDDLDTLDHH